MRAAVEALMYIAFGVAALPFAWLGVRELLYYRSHPEMLESRDAALAVFAAIGAVKIMAPALAIAAALALYFLVAGPRAARRGASVLAAAWIVTFAAGFLGAPFPYASTGRLYWDAIPFVALSMLAVAFAGIRLRRREVPASS